IALLHLAHAGAEPSHQANHAVDDPVNTLKQPDTRQHEQAPIIKAKLRRCSGCALRSRAKCIVFRARMIRSPVNSTTYAVGVRGRRSPPGEISFWLLSGTNVPDSSQKSRSWRAAPSKPSAWRVTT